MILSISATLLAEIQQSEISKRYDQQSQGFTTVKLKLYLTFMFIAYAVYVGTRQRSDCAFLVAILFYPILQMLLSVMDNLLSKVDVFYVSVESLAF